MAESRDKALARQARYRGKHREELRAKGRVYYQEHKEQYAELRKRFYTSHPDYDKQYRSNHVPSPEVKLRQLARTRLWRARNKVKVSLNNTQYAKEHPLQFSERSSRRRALIRGLPSEKINFTSIILRDSQRCGLCGRKVKKEELSFDHIVPLSCGGHHVSSNIQVAHRHCNYSRNAGYIPAQMRLAI